MLVTDTAYWHVENLRADRYKNAIICVIVVWLLCACFFPCSHATEPKAENLPIPLFSFGEPPVPGTIVHSAQRPLFGENFATRDCYKSGFCGYPSTYSMTKKSPEAFTGPVNDNSRVLGQDSSVTSPVPGRVDKSMFTPQELQYACWNWSLHDMLPGHGRELPIDSDSTWSWQWMPNGELYRSYFASNREARLGIHFVHEDKLNNNYWDPILGGKIALLRYGNKSKLYPEGFQVDVEGAALARLTLNYVRDLYGTDYRFAVPLTWRKGSFEAKLGYYHISSHMGDEWIVNHYKATGEVFRRNYVRDCVMVGMAWRPDANWRFYLGGDYAFNVCDGAEPWQVELGAEFSPIVLPGFRGSPFAALHFNWNEENDWDTYAAFQAGWQWKTVYQQTLRTGLYTMAGHADQYQFYNRREKQIGFGVWYDF